MARTKHTAATPGPWQVKEFDTTFNVVSAEGIQVVTTSWHGRIRNPYPLKDEARANARLIAAAPDLLAALKEAEADLSLAAGIAIGYDLAPVLATIRAALAKAEGSSHD